MKKCVKKFDISKQKIKRRVSIGNIPDTEQWLNKLAEQGFVLSKIQGNTFWFEPTETESVSYFMLSPEKGANNSAWIYYEFLENGGIKVPHYGTSHLSPNLVLKVTKQTYQENEELFRYYFMHRNYRLYHRLISNILLSTLFFLLCVIVICLDYSYLISLLCICIGSLLVGLHNIIAAFQFLRSCRLQGVPAMWKRPRRPDY